MIGCCLFSLFAPAQGLPPVLIKTLESDAQMKIDGVLDEPVWRARRNTYAHQALLH